MKDTTEQIRYYMLARDKRIYAVATVIASKYLSFFAVASVIAIVIVVIFFFPVGFFEHLILPFPLPYPLSQPRFPLDL